LLGARAGPVISSIGLASARCKGLVYLLLGRERMKTKTIGVLGCGVSGVASVMVALSGCVKDANPADPTGSEVAVSTVSGALNNTTGSSVALLAPARPRGSRFARALDALDPIGTAWAATWTCSGGSLSPTFAGPADNPYSYTPVSCSVQWDTGRTASAVWSGPFTLSYGTSCDSTHAFIENQAGGCELTRTTSGDVRTLTGPDGNSYAITHDTNGAGTGWDPSVSPAPADGGVQLTCAASGCAAGQTLVINGSHLTGDVDIAKKDYRIWDHTVSTGAGGVAVTGSGTSRVVSGTVTVQHNILRFTSTTTFTNVGYAEPACCFPTSGGVSTTFSSGPNVGKTESITFSPACGEVVLTNASGSVEALTLEHCL
jgi:hypothetical protein